MFVMLLLNVITQIPQLNMAKLFALENEITDPERQLLADSSNNSPTYSRQVDEDTASLNPNQTSTNNDHPYEQEKPKY